MTRRTPPEERFWKFVQVGDCWLWIGSLNASGYGQFNPGGRGRPVRAHRWAWEHLVGPIPEGLHIDHLCRNPPCVNPDHLEPVTPAENTRRGHHPSVRTRRSGTCRRGHVLAEVGVERVSATSYTCRACRRDKVRQRYHVRSRERGVRPRLTADQVRAIRDAYAAGTPRAELAQQYERSFQTIWHITTGITWTATS